MACLDTGQTFSHTLLHPLDGGIALHAYIYRGCSTNATAQSLEPGLLDLTWGSADSAQH